MLRRALSRLGTAAFIPASKAWRQYGHSPRGGLLLGGVGGWLGLSSLIRPVPERRGVPDGLMVGAISHVLPSTVQIRVEMSGKRVDHPAKIFTANGTGFVIDSEGLILTNAHVVGDVLEGGHIRLIYHDGQSTWANLVGLDFQADLALLRPQNGHHVCIAKYPAVRMVRSNEAPLPLGSPVVAIGNPLGLHNSVALGVVAGTNRSSEDARQPDSRIRYLQTDLHTGPGSSGGPVIRADGTVVGIVTTRADIEGITFAIQLDSVQEMIAQLEERRRIFRPWIGIKGISLSPELLLQVEDPQRRELLRSIRQGVLVTKIHEKSPARDADLKPGDIIMTINHQPVACLGDILCHTTIEHPKIDIQAMRIDCEGAPRMLNTHLVANEFDVAVGGLFK